MLEASFICLKHMLTLKFGFFFLKFGYLSDLWSLKLDVTRLALIKYILRYDTEHISLTDRSEERRVSDM